MSRWVGQAAGWMLQAAAQQIGILTLNGAPGIIDFAYIWKIYSTFNEKKGFYYVLSISEEKITGCTLHFKGPSIIVNIFRSVQTVH